MFSASGSELHPRRLDDAIGYYYGELSPRERARFEEHLRNCEACIDAVATAGVIFPALREVLTVPEPRLTIDDLLTRMEFERRRLANEKPAPAVVERPLPFSWARRWMIAAAPILATTVLVVFRISLFTGPGFLLASPRRPGIARTPLLELYAKGTDGAIRRLQPGTLFEVAGDGKVHFWAQGDPGDREALLVLEDSLGHLMSLWPAADDRHGAPCANGCGHLDLAVDTRVLPPGTTRAVLWLGPGPLDASHLKTLGRGEPPSLRGARASTWFELQR